MQTSQASDAQFIVNLQQQPTEKVRVTCEGLSAKPRPDGDRETLYDYGDEVAQWLSTQIGAPGLRLSGIGDGIGYGRVVITNPKQGDVPEEKDTPLSLADEAPVLLCSEASLSDLNRHLCARNQLEVGMDRFRPNIVVSGGLRPWEEDTWKRVRIGKAEFWVWQRCARCEMITINRDSLTRGKEPLATLASFRKRAHGGINFGMHLIPCSDLPYGSQLVVGQELVVLEYDAQRRSDWTQLYVKS